MRARCGSACCPSDSGTLPPDLQDMLTGFLRRPVLVAEQARNFVPPAKARMNDFKVPQEPLAVPAFILAASLSFLCSSEAIRPSMPPSRIWLEKLPR